MGERSLSFGCVSVSILVCPDSIWGPDFRSAFESLAAPRFLDRSFLRSDDLDFLRCFSSTAVLCFVSATSHVRFHFPAARFLPRRWFLFTAGPTQYGVPTRDLPRPRAPLIFLVFFRSRLSCCCLTDFSLSPVLLRCCRPVLSSRTTVLHFCCRLANGFVRAHRSAPYTSSFSFRSSAVRCSVPMPEPVARR
jgi:hypothetical protein